ncbi:hypothetical protein MHM88_06215 [Epibacterium sp. MM17-32]|uniref:hypothetical protein n=1 Tax=Epibacterium sp. MM17-32 TaxID=2917734 RepID=UPI001EF4C0A4|nr:hypothetical protein [Epibacterium sp. MM17-32]MCG7627393.1 hypothetical protein [Epibacterium sp. MM17-32]
MIDNYIDHSDEKKARKALLAVSISTILVANMKFATNKLDILGLELLVDQTQLVAFGKLTAVILLIIFIVRSIPGYLKLLHKLSVDRANRQEQLEISRWVKSWGFDTPTPPVDDPNEEKKEIENEHKYRLAKIEKRYSNITFGANAMALLVVDYGVPLIIGLVAANNPELVQTLLKLT